QTRHAGGALCEDGQHCLLGGAIRVGDQVDAALERDVAGPGVEIAQDLRALLRRGNADFPQLAAHFRNALSSLSCSPPKEPLDMARTTSPLRASLASVATMASGDSIQRAGVPALAMSSTMRFASTRSDSGTLALAVGWL